MGQTVSSNSNICIMNGLEFHLKQHEEIKDFATGLFIGCLTIAGRQQLAGRLLIIMDFLNRLIMRSSVAQKRLLLLLPNVQMVMIFISPMTR